MAEEPSAEWLSSFGAEERSLARHRQIYSDMDNEAMAQYLRERWKSLAQIMRQDDHPSYARLAPLVEAMSQHPAISQLFPFTSHDILCLSRTTRYPFSGDCPSVVAVKDGFFKVSTTQGESNITETIARIASDLPPGCGLAIDGDIDNLKALLETDTNIKPIADYHG